MQQDTTDKRCARCLQYLPHELFYHHKGWSDGLHPYCKPCLLAYQRAKRKLKLEQSPGHHRWKRDQVRHDYFSQIDSPMKAYVLGVLAADGNVISKLHRITLELSAKDANLLETVRDELVPGGTISTRHRNDRDYQVLVFTSHQMVKDLEIFGVTDAKSRTIEWPEKLPSCFAREFILGYFDGDGFITYHQLPNRRYPYIGIASGSRNLLVRIADVIEEHTSIRLGGPWRKENTNAYCMRAAGDNAIIIDKWLHASGLGLKRKRLS